MMSIWDCHKLSSSRNLESEAGTFPLCLISWPYKMAPVDATNPHSDNVFLNQNHYMEIFVLFVCRGGHTWWYAELTSLSVLRDYSW